MIFNDSEEVTVKMQASYKKIIEKLKDSEIGKSLNLSDWVIEQAPLHSNIIWDKFFLKQDWKLKIKDVLINLLLLVLVLSFATPYFLI